MIIANLEGGLGNQLFQYAAGCSLAEMHQVDFKINTLPFETYKLHKFSLHHFDISATIASHEEIRYYRNIPRRIVDIVTLPYYRRRLFYERFFHFDENFAKAPKDTLLVGYWQSEKYFKKITDALRKEFSFKSGPDGTNAAIADQIRNSDSISVHIRRGDYVTDPKASRMHGSANMKYYEDCVNRMITLVKIPVFFIFSDDPEWVKVNFRLKHPSVYIDHNDADANFEDLRLMSLCKHNIIANSSFSWWGAWLNANSDKNVLCPQKWFNNSIRNTMDLIPAEWQKI